MSADRTFSDVALFAAALRDLHMKRRSEVVTRREKRIGRAALTRKQRDEILGKTDQRCHICGGEISGEAWQANHVLAYATGGRHDLRNYLPAHALCNRNRWHYIAEELQWIGKLGAWLRTQIEKETPIGKAAGQAFCMRERHRSGRRKPSLANDPRFLRRVEKARTGLRSGRGVRLENLKP